MKNKKLTDELLIAFLEGNLSDSDKKNVQDLINQNDKNFMKYSRYYASYKQMKETDFEVAPDQLIQAANKKFGLAMDKGQSKEKRFSFFKLPEWTKNNRALGFATLTASAVILLTVINLQSPIDSQRPIITRSIPKKGNDVRSVNLVDGLAVTIEKDSIFVKQPFRFSRSLIVKSADNNILLMKDFTNMDESFELLGLSKNDSIYIVIETLGKEIYNKRFYLKD